MSRSISEETSVDRVRRELAEREQQRRGLERMVDPAELLARLRAIEDKASTLERLNTEVARLHAGLEAMGQRLGEPRQRPAVAEPAAAAPARFSARPGVWLACALLLGAAGGAWFSSESRGVNPDPGFAAGAGPLGVSGPMRPAEALPRHSMLDIPLDELIGSIAAGAMPGYGAARADASPSTEPVRARSSEATLSDPVPARPPAAVPQVPAEGGVASGPREPATQQPEVASAAAVSEAPRAHEPSAPAAPLPPAATPPEQAPEEPMPAQPAPEVSRPEPGREDTSAPNAAPNAAPPEDAAPEHEEPPASPEGGGTIRI